MFDNHSRLSTVDTPSLIHSIYFCLIKLISLLVNLVVNLDISLGLLTIYLVLNFIP